MLFMPSLKAEPSPLCGGRQLQSEFRRKYACLSAFSVKFNCRLWRRWACASWHAVSPALYCWRVCVALGGKGLLLPTAADGLA